MKIHRVAEVIDGYVHVYGSKEQAQTLAACLTSLEVTVNPDPTSKWGLEVRIGVGEASKSVLLELAPQLPLGLDNSKPHLLLPSPIAYFRRKLFLPHYEPLAWLQSQDYLMSVHKYVMLEDFRKERTKEIVASSGNSPSQVTGRTTIPADVKLAVWVRDGAACVTCGSQTALQFDHVIPVSKGGGNTEANLRVLCQPCNLRKSDRIAAP